jgi:DNA primase
MITAAEVQRFQGYLRSNPDALEYLYSRGLTDETINRWEIGFCPPGYPFMLEKRVTFPIRSWSGELVACGGRILPSLRREINGRLEPKYINTSYEKTEHLYGLYQARSSPSLRDRNYLIVVEDYMGVVMASQFGFDCVVSICGTSLSVMHLGLLLREGKTIVFALDPDEGGQKGVERAKKRLGEYQVPSIVLALEKDLDELLVEDPSYPKRLEEELSSITRPQPSESELRAELQSLRYRLRES